MHHLPNLCILPTVPQSLAKILVHTVFSTKERRPFLRDHPQRDELHHYLGGILQNLGCQPLIVGGSRTMCTPSFAWPAPANQQKWSKK